MYCFQKYGLFYSWLLNTLMFEDEPSLKDIIYSNLHEFSVGTLSD